MKKRIFSSLIAAIFLQGTAAIAQLPQKEMPLTKQVILISIDGLRPEFYLDTSRPTPNMQQLMKLGVHALEVKSVFPPHTYPSHTAMVTGATPKHSGIYHNAPFEPEGITGKWFWETSSIKTPTLWQAVHKAGLQSAAIQWPCSVDPLIDYNVPEIWDVKATEDRITESRKYAGKGLMEELEQNATGKLSDANMHEGTLSLDENLARMAAYIYTKHKPAFIALHLPGLDVAEHEQGREGDKVNTALAGADHAIGMMLEAVTRSGMKDSTTILITGDHGFMDVHHWMQPNKWLQDAGLSGMGKDWKVKFQAAGGSLFLYLQDPKDQQSLKKVRQMLEAMPAGKRKLFRIIEQQELEKMGAHPAAVLALAAVPGVAFTGSIDQMHSLASVHGHHGYDPEYPEMMTGFIAAGAGVQKGMAIPRMELVDIAPLIARLLGLEFKAPDGILYPGMLKVNQ